MRDGSGNGKAPKSYSATATDSYNAARENIEQMYPRIRQLQLFDLIETYVRSMPPNEFADYIGAKTWSLPTRPGVGVPALDVYFTFEAEHITLREVFVEV